MSLRSPPIPAATMKRLSTVFAVTGVLFLSACSSGLPKGIAPVAGFEADRYLGTWFEIARLDHRFERGLHEVSATYSKNDDGSLKVINRGWDREDEAWNVADGKAKFVQAPDTGWLKVSFFGPFYGDYVVFELADDYSEAWVTGSDRDYLWYLSRTPTVSEKRLQAFRDRVRDLGYDVDDLILVDQDAAPVPPPE